MSDQSGISHAQTEGATTGHNQFFRIATPLTLVVLCLVLIPVEIFDKPLFSLMNAWHSRITDVVWWVFTNLGDGLVLCVLLGAFLVVNPRVTALGMLLFAISGILAHVIKGLLPTLRPAEALDTVHVIGPLLRSGSFPSGHAASAMAAGLAIAYYSTSRWVGTTVLTLALLVSVSRVFVGAHFPSDVIGGIIVSLALFYLITASVWPRCEARIPEKPRFTRRRFRAFFYLETAAAAFMLVVYAPFLAYAPVLTVLIALGVLAILGLWWWANSGGTERI